MPSEKILQQKQQFVEELAAKLQSSVSIVLVDYKGISVVNDTLMRAEMREADVDYFVVKNSLLKLACEKAELTDFLPFLVGSTSLALSDSDPIAPARVVQKYADKMRDIFNTKAAHIDGKLLDPKEIKTIATLPPRETLIAMVAGTLNGIIASLARAVSEVANQKENAA